MLKAYCKNILCEDTFIVDAIKGNNQTTAMLHVIAPISQIFLTCKNNAVSMQLIPKIQSWM
jgi:hypothetical protein